MEDVTFRTEKSVHVSLVHGLIGLAFLLLILLGHAEWRLVGWVGLAFNALIPLTNRKGEVILREREIQIKTALNVTVRYDAIREVKPYEEPPQSAWKDWVFGPQFRTIKELHTPPMIGLYLHSPRWMIHLFGIPVPVRFNTVRIIIPVDDQAEFINAVSGRMTRSSPGSEPV
jgi:hypothetical protein